MTDWRALCAELLQALETEGYAHWTVTPDKDELCLRTRAALAQPEPEGPTPDHVNLISFAFEREPWATWLRKGGCLESAHCELSNLMLAVLAHWGRPAIEPVPVSTEAAFAMGQTGGPPSEAERLAFEAWMRGHSWLVAGRWNGITYADPQEHYSSVDVPAMQTRMLWAAWRDRSALGRPAIKPVPVSERPWEREGWCDAENRCYGWDGDYWWMIGNPEAADETITHWLPHYALPVPTSQETTDA